MKKTLSLFTVSQKQVGTSLSRIYLKELKTERKRLEETGQREGGPGKEGREGVGGERERENLRGVPEVSRAKSTTSKEF